MAESARQDDVSRKAKVFNAKHNFYRHTRCTSISQEEASALPAGVINVNEDSDDEDAYTAEQKEIAKEMDEIRGAQQWVNPEGCDLASEGIAYSATTGEHIDLRLDWGQAKRKLERGMDADDDADLQQLVEADVLRDYPLDVLDSTQRAFADRVLSWGRKVVSVYQVIADSGVYQRVPKLRTWLGGSAGSGKSTTLRTVVQHLRLLFQQHQIDAKVALTAYTGVAAFNIGFGARTASSAFHIFPKAAWAHELSGAAYRKLEDTWKNVVLLIVDEISFIGRAFFARMHFRLQQGKRAHFSLAGLDPNEHTFGDISIILVGDFGQLEPIEDWSMCDAETTSANCPKPMRHLLKHAKFGHLLVQEFKEAFMLSNIHRSKEDLWWTESCLRLRDFQCTYDGDYEWWRQHDLDRGHLNQEQKKYFEDQAVWLCARCEDVGARNGRKLAHLAEDSKEIIHQIHAQHSRKSAKKLPSSTFDGLRSVIHLVRGSKVMISRNVAYLYGLANGTRGTLVGVVYPRNASAGTMPEALVLEIPDYCGPVFYEGEPKWVPILPITSLQESTRATRTQFPVVAGFALTVNKAQGLTIKEGVVIHLVGSKRFRPASKHGLPFVAFTRSESFAMTAFKNLPPWHDFLKGKESDMLRMRNDFTERLQKIHDRTMAKWGATYTQQARASKHRRLEGPRMPCPMCTI